MLSALSAAVGFRSHLSLPDSGGGARQHGEERDDLFSDVSEPGAGKCAGDHKERAAPLGSRDRGLAGGLCAAPADFRLHCPALGGETERADKVSSDPLREPALLRVKGGGGSIVWRTGVSDWLCAVRPADGGSVSAILGVPPGGAELVSGALF